MIDDLDIHMTKYYSVWLGNQGKPICFTGENLQVPWKIQYIWDSIKTSQTELLKVKYVLI